MPPLLIGGRWIRRSTQAPAGLPAQRIAWARATALNSVAVVFEQEGDIVIFGTPSRGPQRATVAAFMLNWERP